MKNFVRFSLLLTILIFSSTSGLRSTSKIKTSAVDEIIVYAHPYEFNTFSTFVPGGYIDNQWMSAVYSGLYKRSPTNNNSWIPDLANIMPIYLSNNTQIFIELKKDLKFSNGNNLTADDVVFSYQAFLTPEIFSESFYPDILYKEGIYKIDDEHLIIELNNTYAFPMQILSTRIVDQEHFQTRYDNCLAGNSTECVWNQPNGVDAISAGPFKVDSIDTAADIVTLSANPYYYNAHLVKTDKIIFQKIVDPTAALAAFTAETVDILDAQYLIPTANVSGIPHAISVFGDSPNSQEFSLNHLHPIWGTGKGIPGNGGANVTERLADALLVRKALSHIVNRDNIVNNILEGNAFAATSVISRSTPGYNTSLQHRNYSISVARNYMEMAGFDFGTLGTEFVNNTFPTNFFNITMLSPNTNPARNQWTSDFVLELPKIGIGVIENISEGWGFVIPRTFGHLGSLPPLYPLGGFDILAVGYDWSLDFNPIGIYDEIGRCDTGNCDNFLNFDIYQNETNIAALMDDYLSEIDFELRIQKVQLLQQALYNNIPVLPISYSKDHWVYHNNITGFDPKLLSSGNQNWSELSKSEFIENESLVTTPPITVTETFSNTTTLTNTETVTSATTTTETSSTTIISTTTETSSETVTIMDTETITVGVTSTATITETREVSVTTLTTSTVTEVSTTTSISTFTNTKTGDSVETFNVDSPFNYYTLLQITLIVYLIRGRLKKKRPHDQI